VPKDITYQHVPRVAATDFSRTAKPDVMAREIDETGVKKSVAEAGQVNVDAAPAGFSTSQRRSSTRRHTRGADKARLGKDAIRNVHQLQRIRAVEDEAQISKHQEVTVIPNKLLWQEDIHVMDVVSLAQLGSRKSQARPLRDRQDWAQKDEVPAGVHRTLKDLMNPFFRRRSTIGTANGKTDQHRSQLPDASGHAAVEEYKKHKMSIFLARFKL